MTESSPILLPLLRGPLPLHAFETPAQPNLAPATGAESAPQWSGALRLWPGLPDAPANYFCPDKYPFSPREAQACLGDLQQMGDAALSGLPVGAAAAAGNSRAARRASEMALIKGLDSSDGNPAAALAAEAARKEQLALSQAQKALLWAWLQEGTFAELAELTTRFAHDAGGLTAALGVDPDEDLDGFTPDALTGDLVRLGSPIALDTSLVPPWRLVTANALYFVPADAPLVVEGPMRNDLLDLLDFAPAQRWQGLLENAPANAVAVEARAPGWQVLGHTRPTGQPPLDAERVWVTWRIEA
ncbi:MAG: hypothetical protein EOM56_03995 [Deltaproteobacteria bacterium]|nr:hypothetical protein [Deltaproteobacteria bacterium]